MSGYDIVGLRSDRYVLQVWGGISSWDYDGIRERERVLSQHLQRLKPKLDKVFAQEIQRCPLKVLNYQPDLVKPSISGLLIEMDAEAEESAAVWYQQGIEQTAKTRGIGWTVSVEQPVKNSSFRIALTVMVKQRVRRDHLEQVLLAMAGVIEASELRPLLY